MRQQEGAVGGNRLAPRAFLPGLPLWPWAPVTAFPEGDALLQSDWLRLWPIGLSLLHIGPVTGVSLVLGHVEQEYSLQLGQCDVKAGCFLPASQVGAWGSSEESLGQFQVSAQDQGSRRVSCKTQQR